MKIPRKKVCLLLCNAVPGVHKDSLADWLSNMPELSIIADVEPFFVFDATGADSSPMLWAKLADTIQQYGDRYDGFVVIHGLDHLLYAASALSFLLPKLRTPIVFTGSHLLNGATVDPKKLGMQANLINAVQVATFDFGEVCVMFGNRLVRANQARQVTEETLNLFTAPANGILGKIDFSIRLFDKLIIKSAAKTVARGSLADAIEYIRLSPLCTRKILQRQIRSARGVVVDAGQYQNIPEELLSLFEHGVTNVPVIIWSDTMGMSVVGVGNMLVIHNMTLPATVTKLQWALSQVSSVKKINELMRKDSAGELMYLP